MSWGPSSRTMVQCDAPPHLGNRSNLIEHGAAVSAIDALKAAGWRYVAATQKHTCPECVAIARARGR